MADEALTPMSIESTVKLLMDKVETLELGNKLLLEQNASIMKTLNALNMKIDNNFRQMSSEITLNSYTKFSM